MTGPFSCAVQWCVGGFISFFQVLPDALNLRQRQCYDVIEHHYNASISGQTIPPLRMMILGTAGTGKSWLVYALSRLLGGHVRRAAPTGMAAFLIAGCTLHSLLRLPVKGGRNLQGAALKALQNKLAGVRYIVIDELSMVSQAQFAWVDRRLRQATGKDEAFGGISVVMTGDPGQLPPVGGTPLHKLNPQSSLNQEGLFEYRLFVDVFILDRVQRQSAAGADDPDQAAFIDLLPRARDGRLNEDDWKLLLTRQPNNLSTDTKKTFEDATRLFYSKNEVNKHNGKKLRDIGSPVAKCSATHSGQNARKATADTAGGLERDLYLAKGAKVMLSKNLHQEVGLVNGIRGEVIELVYAEDKPAPHPPLYVVVRFDGYSGGNWSDQERYSGCVPIAPVDSSWADGGNQTRTQLPLKLCWAITMHKSQGQTLLQAVVDLGVKESCTGLTFVCLSRAKHIKRPRN